MAAALVARVPSSRDAETVYELHVDDGHYTCTCAGFWRWGHCKHASALAALRALPLETVTPRDDAFRLWEL